MLVVMPVCHVDLDLAKNLSAWLVELGGVKKYPALLVWAPEVCEADRHPIRENFRTAFATVREMEPHLGPEWTGWPAAPNRTFEAVVKYCCEEEPLYAAGDSWFFLEADQCPLKEGWLDEIVKEYKECGRPCMGPLEQSWMLIGGNKVPAGKHLVGTSIYPACLPLLTQAYKNLLFPAFDVQMAADLVDKGHCAHTNLIQHNWLTQNYRRELDGSIVCDRKEGRLAGQIGFSLDRKVVPNTCVMVHGCKDGSLLKILREARNPASTKPRKRHMKRRSS